VEVSEDKLELESWMTDASGFDVNSAELTTSNFVHVADYKLEVESWMIDASVFDSKNAEVTSSNFENVGQYKSEPESWMIDVNTFEAGSTEKSAGTVVDIAVSNTDFSILVEAVTKAGLAGALSADGPFTVFAPTNEAFNALFKKLGVTGIKDLTAEQLKPILTYHVVSGKVMSTDLSNTSVATLNGQKIKVDITNGVHINESKVVKADISGSNGVVHVIDRVLLPK
jgi:transforming growth factor-beta-induced protein